MNDCARTLRNGATKPERILWQHLRRRQMNGFKFRRQHPIGRYICGFVCLEARLVAELDGSQHIGDTPCDANRDAFLKSGGFRVLRFWNGDVLSETKSVVDTIYEALHRQEMDGRLE